MNVTYLCSKWRSSLLCACMAPYLILYIAARCRVGSPGLVNHDELSSASESLCLCVSACLVDMCSFLVCPKYMRYSRTFVWSKEGRDLGAPP